MEESTRLRQLSHTHTSFVCFAFLCIAALFSSSTFLAAADYVPASSKHPTKVSLGFSRPATTARVALFERNDPVRAAKLAQLEIRRFPKQIASWFPSMESAALLQDEETELRSAVAICRLAKQVDPRASLAAIRLKSLGSNSRGFREERQAIESLAAGNGACANAALTALYEASLDGLPSTSPRELAVRAGWLTKWTISRAGSMAVKPPAERFEFADARMRIPDYLPASAVYSADADFVATEELEYAIGGELAGAQISIDGKNIDSRIITLSAGPHRLNLVFRAGDASPRVRVAPYAISSEDSWAHAHLPRREIAYVRAAISLADLEKQKLPSEELKAVALDQVPRRLTHPSCSILTSTLNALAAAGDRAQASTVAESLQGCAPDSLFYARWLLSANRRLDALMELRHIVREWPLDREAHLLLVAELQREGNNLDADRAAAEFLQIAPNARIFRRMARNAAAPVETENTAPFYQPYRRPSPEPISADTHPDASAVILLQDKIAITRLDGSVSMYMHRVVQLLTPAGAAEFQPLAVPSGGQVLKAHVLGSTNLSSSLAPLAVRAGDEIEEEYVVHYTGDGGMISHPEAFQYVFNDFDNPLLKARFIVITPSNETPGYVIASGNVPPARTEVAGGMRAQIWEKTIETAELSNDVPAIVRVVENENGWSTPPSVERRRILETIHPGPRPREAKLIFPQFPTLLN